MAEGAEAPLAQVDDVMRPPIRAAGGVVWRRRADGSAEDGVEVAIIHRPRYDDWSLPKGKLAAGEPDLEGAVREVLEETGYHVRVGRPLGETRYSKQAGGGSRTKVVRWWAMQAEAGAFSATREVDDLEWLSLAEASDRLTRDTDRDVLERFARGPGPSRTLLLVRHAMAGSSSTWDGDDRDRPLDDCGVAQADELVRILSRFEIGTIASADVRRCVGTVEPLADAQQLIVVPEPLLSEVGYPGREEEVVMYIRSLGGSLLDAVACSQGDVIPDLLGRIAREDEFPLEQPVRASKGSTWALSLDPEGRLVALDYLDAPQPPECTRDSSLA